jgi:hypothetical protein
MLLEGPEGEAVKRLGGLRPASQNVLRAKARMLLRAAQPAKAGF